MKNKIYSSTFEVPIYNSNITVAYCKNDLKKLFEKYKIEDDYKDYKYCEAVTIVDTHIIHIFFANLKLYNIVHEAFHATANLLRGRYIGLDSKSAEEAYAYLLSYITWRIVEILQKHGKIN